ncbi:MAG: hypothetical protein HON14_15445, partial [Rhodospirillaceae bacterium]|nr:hypothetical protein [Rhodospirillaceae bacterium]
MRNLIEEIYTELTEDNWQLTERDFSQEWLGKSHAYFAYLKSTDSDPSADVVLHLWKKLETQKTATEYLLPQTIHPVTRSNLKTSLER